MARAVTDLAASLRRRLLNLAREKGRPFDVVLVAFGLERLVYRLSISAERNKFVLKGGMLVTHWVGDPGRFTRDADFLCFGSWDDGQLKSVFADILAIDAADALEFDVGAIRVGDIREGQRYGGKRLKTVALLGTTRIPITVDIGFGDVLSHPQYEAEFGSLLDLETAKVRAYSPECVIAEKLQAVVALGLVNGRMKDLYDLWAIPRAVAIDADGLVEALRATFERRQTEIPSQRPPGLSRRFADDPKKVVQWKAFAEATDLRDLDLGDLVDRIWELIRPICARALARDGDSQR